MASIVVTAESSCLDVFDNEVLEKIVDEDINKFEEFFKKLGGDNTELSRPERSIIKTYVYWKTHEEEDVLERVKA